ncbi:glycoside hydrolase family 13 protein [Parathielavia appendiculata]|uniref:Glycoside hydrolase family 13 protein n=1 Tax=Parathielavia appendiculata TaxID=2587402 RepID=A0AAN6Z387_9PEZI|nr:glycoside hydrolase family 13 protein [Parathielavia appendiculata]
MSSAVARPWWKDVVCYQIYPASFKDSNGDGLGDIPGILSRIDYLKDLGIDVVWISPMFDSPQVDMGYDISDYERVYTPYGLVNDMEDLIYARHQRGIKLILDLVVNHTSDQHAWFKESRSSKDNPRRDWYAEDGTRLPPTNWRSYFSGQAWEYDEQSGEYYLHLFAKEQPDLNWENEETRKAIYHSAMRFWLDKGVDGFRVDVVNIYSKGVEFKDAPIVDPRFYEQPAWCYYANGSRIHEILREMNAEVLNHYDAVTVGELPHTPDPKKVLEYVGASDKQLSMVFQSTLSTSARGASTNQGRSVSRFASDSPAYRTTSAKLLSLMLGSLTGTLFHYQGQEIGMINIPPTWPIDFYRDIESVNFYKTMAAQTQKDPAELEYVMRSLQILGRDNARLPMQWTGGKHAGFTDCETGPWTRVHDLYGEINVERQVREGKGSVLGFWKRMIRLRKEHAELLVHGAYEGFEIEDEKTFVFGKRESGEKRAAVVLNFSGEEQEVELPVYEGPVFQVGNYGDAAEKEKSIEGRIRRLRPWEGRLYLAGC